MIKISKYLSVLLHPILLPTLASIIFFIVVPYQYEQLSVLYLVSLIFLFSYAVPILLLIVFKHLKLISNFNISKANERKAPTLSYIIISFLLGNFLYKTPDFRILSILFFGCLLAMILAYLLLLAKFKTSFHLIGMSGFTAYFIVLSLYFNTNLTSFIALLIFLNGVLATARLILKAHSALEIISGIIFGAGGIVIFALLLL